MPEQRHQVTDRQLDLADAWAQEMQGTHWQIVSLLVAKAALSNPPPEFEKGLAELGEIAENILAALGAPSHATAPGIIAARDNKKR